MTWKRIPCRAFAEALSEAGLRRVGLVWERWLNGPFGTSLATVLSALRRNPTPSNTHWCMQTWFDPKLFDLS